MNIKTERIYIRSLLPCDWLELKNIFMDFGKSEYAVYDAPLPTTDEAVKELTEQFAASRLFFAVFLHASPNMIGYIGFHEDNGHYDLGYCFHSDYQGKGYAREACELVLDYFQQQYNVKCFTAGTALKNTPSCKLLERLGFVLKETEQMSFHKDKTGKEIVFEGGTFIRCKKRGGD